MDQANDQQAAPITRDTCSRCKFAFKTIGGPLECRANAPQVIVVPTRTRTGQQAIMSQSAFPNVNPHIWCGQFQLRLAIEAGNGG